MILKACLSSRLFVNFNSVLDAVTFVSSTSVLFLRYNTMKSSKSNKYLMADNSLQIHIIIMIVKDLQSKILYAIGCISKAVR